MNQKANAPKKENMWNAILNDQSSSSGLPNKNVLILGRKNAGKRSLIDGLTEISKTQYPKRALGVQDMQAGKMKVKGTATLLDYTYLNVLDLNDPDNASNACLNVYIFEEDFQRNLVHLVLNEKQLEHTFVVIALDLQEVRNAIKTNQPWTFMDDLNRWIDTLSETLSKVKVNLKTMDEMRQKCTLLTDPFKKSGDVQFESRDPESTHRLDEEVKEVSKGPLREGILKANLGLPIMVVVTKSDIIEQAEKDKDWDSKIEAILYCLRQFCLTYGATLLFTSQKSNTNVNIFYEYILHRMYDAPLRHKSDTSNSESLFIPIGVEDAIILKSLYTKFSGEIAYEEKVPMPVGKKVQREEMTVDDNQELFKKLKEKQGTSGTSGKAALQINTSALPEKVEEGPLSQRTLALYVQAPTPPPAEDKTNRASSYRISIAKFYSHRQNQMQKINITNQKQNALKESAQQELFSRMKGKSDTMAPLSGRMRGEANPLFNADDKAKIQNIIKFSQPPPAVLHNFTLNQDVQKQTAVKDLLNFASTKKPESSDADAKIKSILNLAKAPPQDQQQQQQG